MKKFFSFFGFLILVQILPVRAQFLLKNSTVTRVCIAGNKVNRVYIPPPKEFFGKVGSKTGGTITVNYTGFSSQGKSAVGFAASILEKLLPADTKITINASWGKISTSGVLAQSSATFSVAGWGIDALNPLSYYPVALAKKISGKNLTEDSEGDITLTVNSTTNWYFGTDGQTSVQKYDLVTVALHEICHGLGFFDSFTSDGTIGSFGFGSVPMIYDTFVENFQGFRLTDTLKFLNNSTALENQLTSDQVYFNGPLLKKYCILNNYSDLRAKLYAPSTWADGSSISHLDETGTLPENILMTPAIDRGEAIHDPGKYTFSILGDIGWINTRIIHTPYHDTENNLTHILLSVEIKSDTLYNHNKVGVVYSFNNFQTSDSLLLTSTGLNNNYNTSVAIPKYNSELQYYFFVEDCFLRKYRSPSLIKDFKTIKNKRYHMFVGTDTVKPVITHTPVAYYFQTVDSIKFNTEVTDNLGIDSVYVEYKINNGPSKFIRLKNSKDNNYATVLKAKPLSLKGHDSLQYKIFAVDTARLPNLGSLPKSGFFVTRIEEISSTVSKYSTDFSVSASDFFNNGFQVIKPKNFSRYGLNSKHPYESPGENGESIEYTSVLRHPLKLSESGILFSYNEIVLVEPGLVGSAFGSEDFFDYVIVEGSKDFGKTWTNLIDGYDSRWNSTWLSDYNSSIVGDNSKFEGTESLLQKHTFLYRPTDKISAGDTLLVRFRLYSDPLANGWGWVIEDLNISPLIDAVEAINKQTVNVYPNPGKGLIRISTDVSRSENSKPLHYNVFNASGLLLINASTSRSPETLVDISDFPSGMYIILLYLDDGIKTIKYSLIK